MGVSSRFVETQTLTLAEFLLARIAEDEATARACVTRWYSPEWRDEAMGVYSAGDHDMDQVAEYVRQDSHRAHIARHDPARVLAECEAKRRIVEDWREQHNLTGDSDPDYVGGYLRGLDVALRYLALSYADHPDFRQEWRP